VPSPYTQADADAFVQHARVSRADGSHAPFVIANAGTGAGLGIIELNFFARDPALAEVGYWLSQPARGRGAATIALRLVSRWAFERNGIHRLQQTTAPANMASQRVAERAGFTREGYLRAWMPRSGGRRDSLMFSLLPTDA